MKRILIVTPTLRSGGGVIRGLQNMLALLPVDKFKISVLPMIFSDSNNVELPNCEILPDNFYLTAVTSIFKETKGYDKRIKLRIAKGVLSILSMVNKRTCIENWLFRHVAKEYGKYDVVVAYQEGLCTRFVQYINASYKIAWIHCDYSEYRKAYIRDELSVYEQYQRIVCVSKYTLQRFQTIYPLLQKRTLFIHNILDKDYICNSANENVLDSKKDCGEFVIVSIGRLHQVKQFHLIPSIIDQMLTKGALNFKWLLIGGDYDSDEYKLIVSELNRLNVDGKYFSYMGSKYNPYPYIKQSDILVSTSSSEACPYVVNEARVLKVPVVSNNYPSIYEFISDGVTGRIVSMDDMPNVLAELIMDRNKLEILKKGMGKDEYNNDKIVKQICELFAVRF